MSQSTNPTSEPLSPPESPSQSPQDPASQSPRAGSERSSTGSAAGSDAGFFADPGPAFDADDAPAAPALEEPELALLEGWREETVRELLTTQGHVTHLALRVREANDQETWKHTREDLDRIAPPLTRMLNRYDVTRAAAAAGDEISLAAAVGAYATRNVIARQRLLAQARAMGEVPVSGREAEPGTGPEHDPAYTTAPADAAAQGELPPLDRADLTPKGPRRGRRI